MSLDGSLHQVEMEPFSIKQAALELLIILLPQLHRLHQIHPETLKKKIAFYFKGVYVPTHSYT